MLESFECPNCLVGRCRLSHYTFVIPYGDKLFCAPNTEVFVCDMCGYQELPYRVLSVYDKFLKPSEEESMSATLITSSPNKKMSFKKSSQA